MLLKYAPNQNTEWGLAVAEKVPELSINQLYSVEKYVVL